MHSKIPLKLALLLGLSMPLGTTGCMGTRNIAIPAGATGVVTGKGIVAFPDKDGALAPGKYEPQVGDLIRRPKTEQEAMDALKAAGVKFALPRPLD